MLKKRVLFLCMCITVMPLKADIPYVGAAWNSLNAAFDYANGHWVERGAAVAGSAVGCLILSCTIPDTPGRRSRENIEGATISRVHLPAETAPTKQDVGSCALASPFKCPGIGMAIVASFLLLHYFLKPQARLVVPTIASLVVCWFWAPTIKYTFALYGATLAGAAFGAAACYGMRSVW